MLEGAGAAGALVSAQPDLREPCRGCLSPAPHPPLLSGPLPPCPPATPPPPSPAQDHPQDLSRGLLRWSWQQQTQVAILPQPCYPPAATGGPGTPRRHPPPQRPRWVLIRDHSTLPRAGERRKDKACALLSQGRRKGNPDRVGGALPEGGAGPGASQSRGLGHPKHSETITTIPASSQPRSKVDSEPGPSLDLFYSTVVSNTIFIPISQMGKLRLREVKQLGSSSQQESELRAHTRFPPPVPETGESPGKVEGSWGPADPPPHSLSLGTNCPPGSREQANIRQGLSPWPWAA